MEFLNDFITGLLEKMNMSDQYLILVKNLILLVLVACVSFIAHLATKGILIVILEKLAKRTKTHWDDALVKRKVFKKIAHIVPAIIFYVTLPMIFENYPSWSVFFSVLVKIYMVIIVLTIINSFLNAANDVYKTYDISKIRPITGYLQVVKIIAILIALILIISFIVNKSPAGLLAGLGAFAAILMLVFKDTILGFIGSIQLTANDMVRPGDWITMPKYGADGDVMEMNLTTVKVRNFDNTITTIPTYSLVSDSFQNWRGMQESGGRRIKRSIFINMKSIKFCTDDMLDKYERFNLLSDYIKEKKKEIEAFNKKHQFDQTKVSNGRKQTNIGVFRAYIQAYLRWHPDIDHENMTFLIRQLQPNETGLPIEIYVFTKTTDWVAYEGIQANIFDHLLAIVPEFDLYVFQNPSGDDFRRLSTAVQE